MQRLTNAYQQTQLASISQGEVLIMLYDGAISFLQQAKECIQNKKIAEKGNLISKAMDILAELDSSLNTDKGGDLSRNLHELYFFCSKQLFQANLRMDIGIIDKVIQILSGLREAYVQISELPEAQLAGQEAAANLNMDATNPSAGRASTGTYTATTSSAARRSQIYAQQQAAASPPTQAQIQETQSQATVCSQPAQATTVKEKNPDASTRQTSPSAINLTQQPVPAKPDAQQSTQAPAKEPAAIAESGPMPPPTARMAKQSQLYKRFMNNQ